MFNICFLSGGGFWCIRYRQEWYHAACSLTEWGACSKWCKVQDKFQSEEEEVQCDEEVYGRVDGCKGHDSSWIRRTYRLVN